VLPLLTLQLGLRIKMMGPSLVHSYIPEVKLVRIYVLLTQIVVYLTVSRRSVIIMSLTHWTFSSLRASTGRPERCASSVDSLPRWNSAIHQWIVAYKGASSPKTTFISLEISFRVKHFKFRYLITARFSFRAIPHVIVQQTTYNVLPSNKKRVTWPQIVRVRFIGSNLTGIYDIYMK